jgi:putative flippase GtrA
MNRLLMEALRYGGASVCALIVDVAILGVLVHYFSWGYLAASATSFSAGMCAGYLLSVEFVFEERRLRDRRIEFAAFAILGVLGLAINSAVMFAAVHYFGLNYLLAKMAAACCTFFCNFISRRQLLFVKGLPVRETIQHVAP